MAKPVRVTVIKDGARYVKIEFLEDCIPFAKKGDIRRVSKDQLVEEKSDSRRKESRAAENTGS